MAKMHSLVDVVVLVEPGGEHPYEPTHQTNDSSGLQLKSVQIFYENSLPYYYEQG